MTIWQKVQNLCSKYNEKINSSGIEIALDKQAERSAYRNFLKRFERKIAPRMWADLRTAIDNDNCDRAIDIVITMRNSTNECARKIDSCESWQAYFIIAEFCDDLSSLLRKEMAA